MVGGVGRGVLLDSDLGNMMDLVVDLVSNMLDNWGSGNMVSSWGSNMVSSWGSNMVGSWSSISISSSWGSNSNWGSNSMVVGNWGSNSVVVGKWCSNSNNWDSMGNWVNETILVHVLRESFQGERSISAVGGNEVTDQRGERSRSCATGEVRLGQEEGLGLGISLSNWGTQGAANKGRKNSKVFHID